MTKSDKYPNGKPSLERARQLAEEHLLELKKREAAVTGKFSIDAVTFWRAYLGSRRPRGWRIKPTEAEQVENDGVII